MIFQIRNGISDCDCGNAENICKECLDNIIDKPYEAAGRRSCVVARKDVRVGSRRFDNVLIALCIHNDSKSSRLFNDKIQALREVYSNLHASMITRCNHHKSSIEGSFKALSHNIVTYNAKSLQAIHLLIPHDEYISASDKKGFVSSCIQKDVEASTDSVLTILKSQELTRNELIVYNKLRGQLKAPLSTEQRHKLHKLIQMALNTFWRDFAERKIRLKNSSCDFYVRVEFESFMAALIHLTDNMAKYALSDSEIIITYEKFADSVVVNFSMMSFFIFPEESDKIWQDGYSGKLAKLTQKDGNGLGMRAIRELVAMNNGEFHFNPEINLNKSTNVNDIRYANNELSIVVPYSKK